MGMRRGRSAHTVEAMPEDYGVAIEWRRGRSTGQGNAPSASGGVNANGASAAPSAAPSTVPSRSQSAELGAWEALVRTSSLLVVLVLLFLPKQARCVSRRAAGTGCQNSYPLLDSPDPSKTP